MDRRMKKVVVLKSGRVLMANDSKARVFKSIGNAQSFIQNLVRVSNDLRIKDFEMIRVGSSAL